MKINLHNKRFKSLSNSENGEVSSETIFHYRQKQNIIWATYEGGKVLFGTLSGRIDKSILEFSYQHQNSQGDFMAGNCMTKIEIENDKILLNEYWQWTTGDLSKGTSILKEI